MCKFFKNKGICINGLIHLSPVEAFELLNNGAVLVDVREDYETDYKLLDVPAVIYIPKSTFEKDFQQLPKDKPLIIVDSVGLRSKDAALFLFENAYEMVANLNGGIVDWDKDKLPIRADKYAELSGSCACMLKPMRKVRDKSN